MIKRIFLFTRVFLLFVFAMPFLGFSQTVGIFYDNSNEQMKFAAADVKTALEAKSLTVEMLSLSSLSSNYANKKVVIALASDNNVTTILLAQGGTIPTGLGDQAYALRTTVAPQQSYWVLGGNVTGAMYGGIEISEQIAFNGFSGTYNNQESPFMLNRGMKLNMPLDKRIPTYVGGWSSTSTGLSIPHVWDITFWKTLIDQQARYRYNLLSVWVHHPFPALVKVTGYENACLPRIEGDNGFVKELNIDQRIAFWREVMQYAHNRGMKFFFFNWNVYVDYASTKYPAITTSQTNNTTIDYMYKSMKSLIATYPELDGFGISAGDGMDSNTSNTEKTTWTWNAMGKAVNDYCSANPTRKFNLIHRSIGSGTNEWKSIYSPLDGLQNVTSNYSHKYAQAHMYSTPTPTWATYGIRAIQDYGKKSFITVRNDDYFYTNWGDPKFVRDFMNGIPYKNSVDGMYIGSDGYTPSRSYLYKNNANNQQIDAERRWYMEMLWGRISYNPATSDDVFKRMLAKRFTTAPADKMFQAWSLASSSLPKVTDLIMGGWSLDFEWYPEGCNSDPGRCTGFRTIYDFANLSTHPNKEDTTVANGSSLCDITNSAAGTCNGKKSSYQLADEMQADGEMALSLINSIGAGGNNDLQLAINNIKQMSYLSLYYAHKIRGATYLKAGDKTRAKTEMGKAYCKWILYTRSMEADYIPTSFRNMKIMPDWKYADAAVLKDYTDMGGVGTPSCDATCTVTAITNGCTGSTVDITGSNNCGGSVTLTAKPAVNCNFVNFTDGTTTWTTNPLTVSVTANKQYTANFSGALQAPVADFTSNTTSLLVGGTVNFTDSSANTPTSWSWSFPGGTPSTSTAQKPSVKYDTVGEYDVTLTTTNAFGSNLKTKAKYVVVSKPATNVTSLTGWVAGTDNPKVPGSNRLLVVMVMGESSGDFAATSVTYGGQTMTKQTDRSYYVASSRSYASIFTLNEAGLNLATNGTIVANWDVTPSSGNSIYSTILSNVDQATPVSAVSNNALTGTTVTIPSGLATASGDMVVMCGATEKNNVQAFDNGFTKEFESDTTWGDGVGGYKIGNGQIETPSFTQSLSGRMVICAFVAKKLAAAPLAIDDFGNASKNGIKIYPNPTSGILNINFPNSDMSREIQIINTLGQKVHSVKTHNNHITIDVKSLNLKGFIIVKVIAEDGVSNHKVLVK